MILLCIFMIFSCFLCVCLLGFWYFNFLEKLKKCSNYPDFFWKLHPTQGFAKNAKKHENHEKHEKIHVLATICRAVFTFYIFKKLQTRTFWSRSVEHVLHKTTNWIFLKVTKHQNHLMYVSSKIMILMIL